MGKCSVSAIGCSLSISGGRRIHVWMLGNDFLHVLKMFRRKKKWKESLCFAQIQIMIDTFPPIITCSCINRYKISCLKSLIYVSICLHIHIKKWSNSRNKKYIVNSFFINYLIQWIVYQYLSKVCHNSFEVSFYERKYSKYLQMIM